MYEKANWVLRKLKEQKDKHVQQSALRIRWENGGQILYLGEKLTLSVKEGAGEVRIVGSYGVSRLLYVGVKDGAQHVVQGTFEQSVRLEVERWMKAQALFQDRCARYAQLLDVKPGRIALTSAATRWGSASMQGVIRLHWRLLEMPMALIDYVVVHELAHLREMNHSSRFWSLVGQVLPDYKQRRLALKKVMLPVW